MTTADEARTKEEAEPTKMSQEQREGDDDVLLSFTDAPTVPSPIDAVDAAVAGADTAPAHPAPLSAPAPAPAASSDDSPSDPTKRASTSSNGSTEKKEEGAPVAEEKQIISQETETTPEQSNASTIDRSSEAEAEAEAEAEHNTECLHEDQVDLQSYNTDGGIEETAPRVAEEAEPPVSTTENDAQNDLLDALAKVSSLTKERDRALQLNDDILKQVEELKLGSRTEGSEEGADASDASLLVELRSSLNEQMSSRAETENKCRQMESSLQRMEEQLSKYSNMEDEVEALNAGLVQLTTDKSRLELEVTKLREEREEFERKEAILSNRLNEAKKKEATKAQALERAEFETANLSDELKETQASRDKLQASLEKLKKKAVERVQASDDALYEERSLNEERKRKMKIFVETKAEELRVSKLQTEEMQREVEEMRTTLRETREKLEHVHSEWQLSQTRNRELLREMKLIKKNSEKMHKIGDNLELELSKSTQETEEHKNKRLTAKHELMTILRTLEAERSVSGKLRESIKFTFTPKALSQQQLLTESLKAMEIELEKLSRRFGKPLPPSQLSLLGNGNATSNHSMGSTSKRPTDEADGDREADDADESKDNKHPSKSEWDSHRLLSNLDGETQKVSQAILALQSSVERLHLLIDDGGERSCVTAFQDILSSMAHQHQNAAIASAAESGGELDGGGSVASFTTGGGRKNRGTSYGLVPGNLPDNG